MLDISSFLKTLPHQPGVYRMFDTAGALLYVGKAKDLKKRVASYFRGNVVGKTAVLVQRIASVEVTITATENEALLLESNLIKEFSPRYNILLRDDKSYPYLFLSSEDEFPRIDFYRGSKRLKGRYFGPFLNVAAVRESLNLLQKLFKLRQCSDHFFKNRTRPCFQYQIKRCSAPCVNYINKADYNESIRHAILFLEGKNTEIVEELGRKMQAAAADQQYETAALYRDQIVQLKHLQEQQYITRGEADLDVFVVIEEQTAFCVTILAMRGGRLLGSKSFFPEAPLDQSSDEVLASFIAQYYLDDLHKQDIPHHIFVNVPLHEKTWLVDALTEVANHAIHIKKPERGEKSQWIAMAEQNAHHALSTKLYASMHQTKKLQALREVLHLSSDPQRIECFDISHTLGEATVASCVVFNETGALKSDYRRFNLTEITPGDDYAAMRQALMRRYSRLKEGEGQLPDILLIDGGKGQLHEAEKVMEELQISGVLLVGVSKGPARKAGEEVLHLVSSGDSDANPEEHLVLGADHPALHLIQQVRDEAHRFAITGHRQRRAKTRNTSRLEDVDGIGPKKRRELLMHFGGLQGIKRARVEELMRVPGISRALAEKIHAAFGGTSHESE